MIKPTLLLAVCAAFFFSNTNIARAEYVLDIDDDQEVFFYQKFDFKFEPSDISEEEKQAAFQEAINAFNKRTDNMYGLAAEIVFDEKDDRRDRNLRSSNSRRLPNDDWFPGSGWCRKCLPKDPPLSDDTHGNKTNNAFPFTGHFAFNSTILYRHRALSSGALVEAKPVPPSKEELAVIIDVNARLAINNTKDILQRISKSFEEDSLKIKSLRGAIRMAKGDPAEVERLKNTLEAVVERRRSLRQSRNHRKDQLSKAKKAANTAAKVLRQSKSQSRRIERLQKRAEQLEKRLMKRNHDRSVKNGTV